MDLGPQEVILILLVVLLLFGAKRLPEVARGTGRALRIFKAETRGLTEEDRRGAAAGSASADTDDTSQS